MGSESEGHAAAGKDARKPSPSERGRRARRYGMLAERATLWLLWLRGWELVAWRWRAGRLEMDLLVARGKELRLVEVKARKPGAWVSADMALSLDQRHRLQTALGVWLESTPWPHRVTFQRVSWAGWRCRFHPPERWDAIRA